MTNLPIEIVIASLVVIAGLSFVSAPRANTVDGFFSGRSAGGNPPGVVTFIR